MPDPASVGDLPTAGGVLPPTAALPPPRVGDYELLGEIARGGMGVVYRARQVSAGREVAVKLMLAGGFASPAERARFRTEAGSAAGLDHPHILPVYEVGEHDGRPFFSMKLAAGCLRDRLPALRSDPRAAAAVVAKLARAVHFAHQRAVLHRDLKPANVLLDGAGEPLLADFGLARRTDDDSGQTKTGAVVGTPSYMPPEQARGDKGLTTAADVYSLGAILYELLAGRPPFRGETVYATLKAVQEEEPPPLPGADRDLVAVAIKCLAKDPAGRYESAAALADDLDRWAVGEPTRARPPSVAERLRRWAVRNVGAAVLVPALAFALAAQQTFRGNTAISRDLLPTSLATPLGWMRVLLEYPGLKYPVAVVTVPLVVWGGWLVVRAARPRSLAAAGWAAAGTAALATLLGLAVQGPFTAEQARFPGEYGRNRVHPVADATAAPAEAWKAAAARPGTAEAAEAEYLARFLRHTPPDSPARPDALADLRWEASQVNRLQSDYREQFALAASRFAGLCGWLVGTAGVTVFLDRRRGRRWWNVAVYLELCVPTLFAFVAGYEAARGEGGDWPGVVFFGVPATLAWVGVARRWRWWARLAVYVAVFAGVAGVVGVAYALDDSDE